MVLVHPLSINIWTGLPSKVPRLRYFLLSLFHATSWCPVPLSTGCGHLFVIQDNYTSNDQAVDTESTSYPHVYLFDSSRSNLGCSLAYLAGVAPD